jgi:hypothetical protein
MIDYEAKLTLIKLTMNKLILVTPTLVKLIMVKLKEKLTRRLN